MELKKVIKTILIGGAVALLGFSTFKACKNNDFSAVKTLTKETRQTTRAERINAPKRAKIYSWENINSWNELNGITLTFKGVASGGTQTAINIYSTGTNRVLIHNGNPIYTISTSANQSLSLYYDSGNQIIRYVGRTASGSVGSTTLTIGDKIVFYANTELTTWNSTIKSILMNSFTLPEPITAILNIDFNIVDYDLNAIYLDDNIYSITNNSLELSNLSDGYHTLTFKTNKGQTCFNLYHQMLMTSNIPISNSPISNIKLGNDSSYTGILTFLWDSSYFTSSATYNISLRGTTSYNFNYLTNKSFILNESLNYIDGNESLKIYPYFYFGKAYMVYNYNVTDSLIIKDSSSIISITEQDGGDSLPNYYALDFGTNTIALSNSGYVSYPGPMGTPPRLLSFTSSFTNDNLYSTYQLSSSQNETNDNMFTLNIVDYLLENMTELTTEQYDTYQGGYNSGYQEGLKYATSISNLIYNFFYGIDKSLSIEILPGIQIKYIIYIPLVLAIVKFILGWFR